MLFFISFSVLKSFFFIFLNFSDFQKVELIMNGFKLLTLSSCIQVCTDIQNLLRYQHILHEYHHKCDGRFHIHFQVALKDTSKQELLQQVLTISKFELQENYNITQKYLLMAGFTFTGTLKEVHKLKLANFTRNDEQWTQIDSPFSCHNKTKCSVAKLLLLLSTFFFFFKPSINVIQDLMNH